MSVIMTASQFPAISSNDVKTGRSRKSSKPDCGSTTPAISAPLWRAQMMAISATSETPASANWPKPELRADCSTAAHSDLARRKKEKEYDKYSTVSRDFSEKPRGVR